MLQKFCGFCRFRQYMPSKPERCGIKYWILADAENSYCYNVIPYLGKEGDAPAVNLGAQVVKNLVEPIKGTSCNVTGDHYFRSVDLFEELYSNNLTAVGTVMRNRRHCQNKLQVMKLTPVYSLSRITWLWFLGIEKYQNLFFYCHLCIIIAILLKVANQRLYNFTIKLKEV